MTIEESINQIIDSLMGKKANLLNHSDRIALTDALNTMCKYQKIEQVVKAWNDMNSFDSMKQISEVLEDDN